MCVRPIVVRENVVPCGSCFECYKADRMNWSIRVQDEIKQGLFVTLTYAPEHYKGKVDKADLKAFIKRLRERERRQNEKFRLKYFGVGEYGGRFGRGHMHLIVNTTNVNNIKASWKKGIIHIGRITGASIHYTTKYIQKNIRTKKQDKKKKHREFRLMSKGLGKNYIEKFGKHHLDNLIFYRIVDGKKYMMPRYYMNKIFDKEDKEYQKEMALQVERKLKKLQELYFGLLRKEADELKIQKFEKQIERYKSLELINSVIIKQLNN